MDVELSMDVEVLMDSIVEIGAEILTETKY